ncbi:MAG: hypothetical protein QOH25_1275 [Acidobacteriota bacterium]|jgi:hypothetical protein|nr:hypothetical protein [Acidobacteriota bacterium]
MNNQDEFFDDIISDEAELDDFESDEDYDEMDDDEDAEVRTVLLAKNEMLALLGLKKSAEAGIIVRVDPRQPLPSAQRYDDIESAVEWFNRSLATSRKNGWEVIFDGEPLYG